MKRRVVTPEDYMGNVSGDINRRRGVILGMEDIPSGKLIEQRCHWQKCLATQRRFAALRKVARHTPCSLKKYAVAPKNVAI